MATANLSNVNRDDVTARPSVAGEATDCAAALRHDALSLSKERQDTSSSAGKGFYQTKLLVGGQRVKKPPAQRSVQGQTTSLTKDCAPLTALPFAQSHQDSFPKPVVHKTLLSVGRGGSLESYFTDTSVESECFGLETRQSENSLVKPNPGVAIQQRERNSTKSDQVNNIQSGNGLDRPSEKWTAEGSIPEQYPRLQATTSGTGSGVAPEVSEEGQEDGTRSEGSDVDGNGSKTSAREGDVAPANHFEATHAAPQTSATGARKTEDRDDGLTTLKPGSLQDPDRPQPIVKVLAAMTSPAVDLDVESARTLRDFESVIDLISSQESFVENKQPPGEVTSKERENWEGLQLFTPPVPPRRSQRFKGRARKSAVPKAKRSSELVERQGEKIGPDNKELFNKERDTIHPEDKTAAGEHDSYNIIDDGFSSTPFRPGKRRPTTEILRVSPKSPLSGPAESPLRNPSQATVPETPVPAQLENASVMGLAAGHQDAHFRKANQTPTRPVASTSGRKTEPAKDQTAGSKPRRLAIQPAASMPSLFFPTDPESAGGENESRDFTREGTEMSTPPSATLASSSSAKDRHQPLADSVNDSGFASLSTREDSMQFSMQTPLTTARGVSDPQQTPGRPHPNPTLPVSVNSLRSKLAGPSRSSSKVQPPPPPPTPPPPSSNRTQSSTIIPNLADSVQSAAHDDSQHSAIGQSEAVSNGSFAHDRGSSPEGERFAAAAAAAAPPTEEAEREDSAPEEIFCYNHDQVVPQRYCNDHNQAVCLECAFELHRSCKEVEVLGAAALGRRSELQKLCEALLLLRAEWEGVLGELGSAQARLAAERRSVATLLEKLSDDAIKTIQAKSESLAEEAESLYAKEATLCVSREDRVRNALQELHEVQVLGERLLASGGQGALLRQFGKLKGRCEALIDTEVVDTGDVMDTIKVTSTWFDDVMKLPSAKITMETRPAVSKKAASMSERGMETFRRISKKKRQNILPDVYKENRLVAPSPARYGARESRMSLARSVASTGSLPSMRSSNSMGFLDGPQSMFEFFAGLESDKYPFGLGDICVMQPRLTILVTYLTSDLLRVFPWRAESSAFVSETLGCTLCCVSQLTTETVAVTSSNSDLLSFVKIEPDRAVVTHAVSMKRQYRAVTALDYRTLALATDSKRSSSNAIVVVRFDSSDYRSFTQLRTIGARTNSLPIIRLLSKTLFKVPYSMCLSSDGDIVVSDSENRALLALRQNGEKRFIFQPPKQSRVIDTPGGVACSPSGYLYLVDSCEQRVLRFDRTGKLRKMVLSQEDGLEWPISVACVDDSTLCVAEFYGQVKVFRVR